MQLMDCKYRIYCTKQIREECIMKRVFQIIAALMVIFVLALSLTACGTSKTVKLESSSDSSSTNSSSGNGGGNSGGDNGKVIEIGIVQIVEHPSLNTIREAFIAHLAENGYVDGKNIRIDYQNAQNEQTNLNTICQKFKSD